jgi:hypothetical protein
MACRLRCLFAAAVVTVFVGTSAFAAEPTDADKATARALMNDGYDALERSDARLAVERFRAADALVHVPTTTFALARAEAMLGRLVEAHETLVRLSRMPSREGDSPEFALAQRQGETLRASLESRIPTVQVMISGATKDAALTVSFDGERIPNEALNMPRKVDPGVHTIAAQVGGKVQEASVQVGERENKSVEIKFAPSDAAPPPSPAIELRTTGSRVGVPTVIGVVVASLGVAAGATTGGLALAARNSAMDKGTAGGQCPPAAQSDCHRAKAFATASTVSFAVAGVGAIGALVSYLWLSPRSTAAVGGSMVPYIGLGTAGLQGHF